MRLRTLPRGALVGVALATVISALVPSTAGAATTPSSWPGAGFDIGSSYWGSSETTVSPTRVAAIKLNYVIPSAPVTDPFACLAPVAPVEAGGRLFDVGPDGVSAYNQWSGARLWNAPPPAYSNGLYYQYVTGMQVIGNDLYLAFTDCVSLSNSHAHILVLDASTGAQVSPEWSTDGGGEVVFAGPVTLGSETNNTVNFVVATDLAGNDLWIKDNWGFGPVGQGLAFLSSDTGVPSAIRLLDGSVAWSLPSMVGARPIALSQDGKDLYLVTSSGGLLSVNPLTGATRMKVVAGRGGPMAVTATVVYSNCGSLANTLCATRRSDGKKLWSVATPAGQPLVADGVVYCGGRTYSATTGVRIKSAVLDGTVISSVSGGRVYALIGSTVESYK